MKAIISIVFIITLYIILSECIGYVSALIIYQLMFIMSVYFRKLPK